MAFGEMIDVARKFKMQYTRLVDASSKDGEGFVQERVSKAAAYYLAKLSEFSLLCGKTKIDTDSKAVRKQFDDRFSTFKNELAMKTRLLKHECDEGVRFSVADYLSAKAKILLGVGDPVADARPAKKAKTPKPVKPNTREISYAMFNEGMSVERIAKERGLAASTILGHLLYYVKTGQVDVARLVSREHIEEVRMYLLDHPKPGSLAEIKEAVSPSITYEEIRLVLETGGNV